MMKKLIYVALLLVITYACTNSNSQNSETIIALESENVKSSNEKPKLTNEFKNYWYDGEAEITSFSLEQERYGEMRTGTAVMVFVTEDFLPNVQVKANNYSDTNIPVLKLNSTKKFNTGIYPYSIMQSTFYPVANNSHALKITASVQEWCGQVYTQLNNRTNFEVMAHSYFQGEADQNYELNKTWTENELWTKLRIDPNSLPVGKLSIIPSLEFTRLYHEELKAYEASASLNGGLYSINYPELNRTLKINFNINFPYDILGWEETIQTGFGSTGKVLTTKATKLASTKLAYWNKNSNTDESLRSELKLK